MCGTVRCPHTRTGHPNTSTTSSTLPNAPFGVALATHHVILRQLGALQVRHFYSFDFAKIAKKTRVAATAAHILLGYREGRVGDVPAVPRSSAARPEKLFELGTG